jgi:hypothetical protein
MCLPHSCVATRAVRTHRERRFQSLFFCCVTSQRTWRFPLQRVYGPLPSNGCFSVSKVLALSKYATISFGSYVVSLLTASQITNRTKPHKLFENERVEVTEGWRNLLNRKLHNFYALLIIINVERSMREYSTHARYEMCMQNIRIHLSIQKSPPLSRVMLLTLLCHKSDFSWGTCTALGSTGLACARRALFSQRCFRISAARCTTSERWSVFRVLVPRYEAKYWYVACLVRIPDLVMIWNF